MSGKLNNSNTGNWVQIPVPPFVNDLGQVYNIFKHQNHQSKIVPRLPFRSTFEMRYTSPSTKTESLRIVSSDTQPIEEDLFLPKKPEGHWAIETGFMIFKHKSCHLIDRLLFFFFFCGGSLFSFSEGSGFLLPTLPKIWSHPVQFLITFSCLRSLEWLYYILNLTSH